MKTLRYLLYVCIVYNMFNRVKYVFFFFCLELPVILMDRYLIVSFELNRKELYFFFLVIQSGFLT